MLVGLSSSPFCNFRQSWQCQSNGDGDGDDDGGDGQSMNNGLDKRVSGGSCPWWHHWWRRPDLLSMQDDHFQYDDHCGLERCDDRYDREI